MTDRELQQRMISLGMAGRFWRYESVLGRKGAWRYLHPTPIAYRTAKSPYRGIRRP